MEVTWHALEEQPTEATPLEPDNSAEERYVSSIAPRRLSKRTYNLGDLTYGFDAAGRRTQVGGTFTRTNLPQPVVTTAYDFANQLTNWNGATPSYDLNGNMLSDGLNTFTWNARNQVSTLNSVSPQYDAYGRRSKNLAGTSFLYDGANDVQELSGSTVTANNITGVVDEFFTRTDSASYYPLTDALGSVIALTNSSGNVVTSYTYDPYGNTTISGTANSNVQEYTGRENDGNGLYYYRARYYDTTISRFISEDPIGLNGGLNFYTYVVDNPIGFRDPFGKDVTVTCYAGEGGNPFGHSGISVNGSAPVGFNPAPGWDIPAAIGQTVPGAVLPITPGRPSVDSVNIPTSPEQDAAVIEFIKNRKKHPLGYQVAGRNCVEFVMDALDEGDIGYFHYSITPCGLVRQLHDFYGYP